MSETAPNRSEHSGEGDRTENQQSDHNLGSIIADIERFSHLSSDLKDCLSGITRKIINSLNELKSIQQAAVQKKRELMDLYEIEASAAALKKLHEEHRLKQSEFENFMETQRRLWEEEKALKEREDEEYRQSLISRRQQEDEDFKNRLAQEQSIIRQKLEEELGQIRRQSSEKQELQERDLIKREQALKEKELEWVKLIQELELFMARLMERTHRKKNTGAIAAGDRKRDSIPIPRSLTTEAPASTVKHGCIEEKTGAAGGLDERAGPSVASIREMLLSQERRIENIQADLKDNRDPVPFRLHPKDNA